ncbi:lysozyme inhibitor LprI family protein [Pseudomonas frederiksbergensis]|nr:lysozyme inhibitor LprI family protein [Pseudomonas frederiksbergensis]
MDCAKAASTVEKTICANKALYELDTLMGGAYRRLVKSSLQEQSELKTAQRAWLKTRDQCAENVECLDKTYRERLQGLQRQWSKAVAYIPDDVDRQVSEDLRLGIQAASATDAEFPLERMLDSLTIKTGTTQFSDVKDNDSDRDETQFPTTTPQGVTRDEWKALTASKIEGAGEYGNSSYTLMDMDGDGRRDLVVDTYAGGTGLFSYIETFHRSADRFVRRTDVQGAESGSSLLSLNDRGANQSVDWINVRGRIYAAYRVSYYGVDKLYLLNPLKVTGTVPIVTVNYRYELSVPKVQKDEADGSSATLDDALHEALTQALSKVSKTEAKDIGDQSSPLCPIPPTGVGDGAYYSYGPGHYTFEIVGDMPVMVAGQCYIGRLMDWFGGYSLKDGLYAQLVMRKPDLEESERSYQVIGKRRMIEVTTSNGAVEGDNGG